MKFFLFRSNESNTHPALNGMENKCEGTEISRCIFSMLLSSSWKTMKRGWERILNFLKLENVEDGTLSWHRLLKYSSYGSSFTDGDLTRNKKKTKQEKKKESRIKTRRGKRQKANSSSSPFQKNWIDKNISRKEASRYNNNSRVYQIVIPISSLFSFDEAG